VAVETLDELRAALERARTGSRTTVIACTVEPRRMLLGNGAWWDLGVARASDRPNVRERAAAHEEGARAQRPYV
jgi:3D-(3,5/4)-trihydroxycyclohexane-1,2-dione acylhydrolase (decyclizing)